MANDYRGESDVAEDYLSKEPPAQQDRWMGLPRIAVLLLVGALALVNLGRHCGDSLVARQLEVSWVMFLSTFDGENPAYAQTRRDLQPILAAKGKTFADVLAVQPPPGLQADDPGSVAAEPIRRLYEQAVAARLAVDAAQQAKREALARTLSTAKLVVEEAELILPGPTVRYSETTDEYEARKQALIELASDAEDDEKITFAHIQQVQPPPALALDEATAKTPEQKATLAEAKAAQVAAVKDREAARSKLAGRLKVTPEELLLPTERVDYERGLVGRIADYVFSASYWPFLRAAGHFAFVLPIVYASMPFFVLLLLMYIPAWGGGNWYAGFMLLAMMSPLLDMVFLQDVPPLLKGQSLGADAWRRIRKDRFAMTCLTVIYFYASVALLCRIEVLATGETEGVVVTRGAWVQGKWNPAYSFKAGADLTPDVEAQAPTLEYQAPSLMTRIELGWVRTFGDRKDLREMLELGPLPTNQQLKDQIAAYQAGVSAGDEEPPPITIPDGNYDAPGADGLYPDERNAIPGWFDYPLGTDFLARDVFKRVLHGTRIAMSVGLVSCVIAIPIGTFFGSLAGFYGGFVDELIVLLYSTVASVPGLLLLLAFVMVVGKGVIGVYVALGMTSWVSLCRLVRGEFIKHKEREYVVAARSLGASNFSCIFKHILPNVFHILIINFSLRFVYAVQSEVILSYLGVGVNDQPSWGVMINDAKLELARGVWWQLAAATIAMFIIVLALNIFGDILRDALDPKLRE